MKWYWIVAIILGALILGYILARMMPSIQCDPPCGSGKRCSPLGDCVRLPLRLPAGLRRRGGDTFIQPRHRKREIIAKSKEKGSRDIGWEQHKYVTKLASI